MYRPRATGSNSVKALVAAAGVVSLIVACSPSSGGRAPITPRQGTAFQSKVQACTDRLKSSQKRQFGDSEKSAKVNLCEYPFDPKIKAFGDKLQPTPRTISYSIQQAAIDSSKSAPTQTSRALNLRMQMALMPSEKIDKKIASALTGGLGYDCARPIEKIFERSRFDGAAVDLRLNLNFVVEAEDLNDPGSDDTDPALPPVNHRLDLVQDQKDGDHPWIFGQLPNQPKYYPSGKKSDNDVCDSTSNDRDVTKKCKWERRHAVNLPVCAALAKRVGQVLGVVNTEHEQATCGAEPYADAAKPANLIEAPPTKVINATEVSDSSLETAAPAPKPLPQPADGTSSFSKATGTDDEFMSKAELNGKDLVSILSLSCPDLKSQTKK